MGTKLKVLLSSGTRGGNMPRIWDENCKVVCDSLPHRERGVSLIDATLSWKTFTFTSVTAVETKQQRKRAKFSCIRSVKDIFGAFSSKFKVSEYFTVYYIQTFLNPKVRRPKVRTCRSTINKPIHQQSDSDKGWKQTASKSHYQAVPAVPAVLRTAALPTVGRLFVTIKGCWPARALPAESP